MPFRTQSVGLIGLAPRRVDGTFRFLSLVPWFGPGANGSFIPNEGELRLAPFPVRSAWTFDQLGVEITVIGTAGAVVRIGLWTDANGFPGTVLEDGTVAGDGATGTPFITPSAGSRTLAPGIYWAGAVVQGGAGTRPTLRSVDNVSGATFSGMPPGQGGAGSSGRNITGEQVNGVAGALPSNPTQNNQAATNPFIWARVA